MSILHIDIAKPTELCEIMNRYGSDKGNGHHNYTRVYSALFDPMRANTMNVFELGLGTNNLDVPSNMGPYGRPGASLYGWREYFPQSQIYGADVDQRILFQSDRIKTYYTDQLSETAIRGMWSQIDVDFDILIDDGLHTHEGNISFLRHSWHKVKKGGLYIIEDVVKDRIPLYEASLKEMGLPYQVLDIPNPGGNTYDNVLIVMQK